MYKFVSNFFSNYCREIIVATICLLMFIVVLSFSNQLLIFLSTSSAEKEKTRVTTAIEKELNDIFTQREQIITSGVFTNPLERNSLLDILVTSQAEAKNRNVDVIITDKDGFVFARSHLPGQQGDNVFQTTIQGRSVVQGKIVTAVVRGARSPLSLISDSLILSEDKIIGSIVVGRILDDAYATKFKKEYLKKGEQIIFYTPQEGIVGDSLGDKDKTQSINTYFSLGPDLGAQNLDNISKEIKIDNDYYIIRHVVFPGLGESPGGAFILFPISHNYYSLLLAGGITIIFLILLYSPFFFNFVKRTKYHKPVIAIMCFIIFFIVLYISLIGLNHSAVELKSSPYTIYNSTMKFYPESDIINQFLEKIVTIKVFTGGEAINMASVVVKYDPKVVEVVDILTSNSFCNPSLFLEKEIDKEKGEVRIACGSPSPGFSDSVGTVADLLIKPLGSNSISLEFTNETQVLANDGLGTNVLRSAVGAYYQIARQELMTDNNTYSLPIFSASHPNSNRWYKRNNIKLSWPKIAGGIYYYSLSNNPDRLIGDKVSSTTSNYFNTFVDDGIHYFHLQAQDINGKLGPVSSFKIMVDTAPPIAPNIKASSKIIKKGEIVRLNFTASDALSGLQSGFYVKMKNSIFLPVNPPFYIPFLSSGNYSIIVRVFDKANNFSDSLVTIHVNN